MLSGLHGAVILPGEPLLCSDAENVKKNDQVPQQQTRTAERLGCKLENSGRVACVPCVEALLPVPPSTPVFLGATSRYYPRINDIVIGLVTHCGSETYRVDICSAFEASLGITSFNGATKQNRPVLQLGSLVISRVLWTGNDQESHRNCSGRVGTTAKLLSKEDLLGTNGVDRKAKTPLNVELPLFGCGETTQSCELTCIVPREPRSWTSGELCLGELRRDGAYSFQVPILYAIRLQGDDCFVLDRLGEYIAFDVAIGANGRVWVKAGSPSATIAVSYIIRKAIGLNCAEAQLLISGILNKYSLI